MSKKIRSIRLVLNEEPYDSLIQEMVEDEVGSDVEIVDWKATTASGYYGWQISDPVEEVEVTIHKVTVKYRKLEEDDV